jgi:hypothetical protein
MSTLTSYLEQYGLISLEKQEKFVYLVGDHTMELDFDSGLARFSGGHEFPFQVLGTESDNTLTWLWAWAEEQTEISPELLRSSLQMREWGRSASVPECTTPSVDLDKADGQLLSMIASEVCNAGCYYQDPYEGGALFLLLFGQAIDRQPSLDAAGLSRRFSHLVSQYEIDHRNALLSYLQLKDLPFTEQGTIVMSELESGEDLRAEFDPAGHLISINDKNFPSG